MRFYRIFISLCIIFTCQAVSAESSAKHAVKIGYANLAFNVDSGDLQGELTPPGIYADVDDASTIAFTYDYYLTPSWSLQFAAGVPPEFDLIGKSAAGTIGKIGAADAVFPALLGMYHLHYSANEIYFGGGFNYTMFVNAEATPLYNQSFGGTSSDVDVEDSFGPVLKLGYAFHFNNLVSLDLSYSRYWVNIDAELSTDTPTIGAVDRSIDLDVDPDVLVLMLGFQF